MNTYLLDANVLIALTVAEHEHHDRASVWLSTTESFALCPIVEGALVRFLLRLGESATTAREVVDAIHRSPRSEFWVDELSYRDVDIHHVVGHRQVTDVYLASLAAARGVRLATFDEALARLRPEDTLLIPPL